MIEELKPCPEMVEKVARGVDAFVLVHTNDAELAIEAGNRVRALTAYDPDKRLREALESARPYVELVARGEGTAPEMVVAECTLNAVDAALSHNGG